MPKEICPMKSLHLGSCMSVYRSFNVLHRKDPSPKPFDPGVSLTFDLDYEKFMISKTWVGQRSGQI